MAVGKNSQGNVMKFMMPVEKASNENRPEAVTRTVKNKTRTRNAKKPPFGSVLSNSPSKILPLSSSSLANINKAIKNNAANEYHQKIPPKFMAAIKQSATPSPAAEPLNNLYAMPFTEVDDRKVILPSPEYCSPTPPFSPTIQTESDFQPKTEADYVLPGSETRSIISDRCSKTSSAGTSSSSCRKKFTSSVNAVEGSANPPVSRRNARERNRVKQVSMGFAILRQHVPQGSRKKKLSKVETLRCAVDYIKSLQSLLAEESATCGTPPERKSPPSPEILAPVYQIASDKPHYFRSPDTPIVEEKYDCYKMMQQDPISSCPEYPQQMPQGICSSVPAMFTEAPPPSCTPKAEFGIETQVLIVPKTEDPFRSSCYSTGPYLVANTSPQMTFPAATDDRGETLLQHHADVNHGQLGRTPSEISRYDKEHVEMDLLNAMNWWQQNA